MNNQLEYRKIAARAVCRKPVDYQRKDPVGGTVGKLYIVWLSVLVTGYLWMVCLPR